MTDNAGQQTERRPVRSEDPSLSDTASELLTHELQEAIGAEEVEVPKDVPDRSDDAHATHSPFVAMLTANRPILIVTFRAALVLGGVVALVRSRTGPSWSRSRCMPPGRWSSPSARSR